MKLRSSGDKLSSNGGGHADMAHAVSCGDHVFGMCLQGPKLTFLYRRQVATENFFSVAK